jgi:regulator of sigma E protease
VGEGKPISKIGISPWRPELTTRFGQFSTHSAAQAQGFLEGDTVLEVNGEVIDGWMNWVELVKSHPEKDMNVIILREQQRLSMTLRPKAVDIDGKVIGRIGVRPWIDREAIKQHQITTKQDFFTAFEHGMSKTYDMSVLTVKLLGKLITGEASTKNISGPISIAEFAGISAQLGLASFLSTLAIISISIGILNLLPVPMLDGGHLMYYLIEMVKGSQVSEAIQILGQKLGIVMLAGLMLLAFYNDIQRLFS